MDSKIGLIVQLNGVFLITVLSFFMRRSLKVRALQYWTIAWLCLSFALICLRLAFGYEDLSALLFAYYFLGEYMFGFLVVAGCRSLNGDYQLKPRSELLMLPFAGVAIVLAAAASDFNDVFNIHSLILCGFFAVAFFSLQKTDIRSFGWRVMRVALALLALDFLFYFIIFTTRQLIPIETGFLVYNSILDLVLQTTLGFGMVIVLLEKVLADFKTANESLQDTKKRLEALVHTDPLTEAFNRHAFYGFMKRDTGEAVASSGCVGFFDIDDLKSINDIYGHTAGDAAIRAVARAIRELIRAEDLIYRWGGDEFFVIMIGMEADMAESRMLRMEGQLHNINIEGVPEPTTIGVSWGFMDFSDSQDLEEAIKKADAAMYQCKQARKSRAVDSSSIQHAPRERMTNG